MPDRTAMNDIHRPSPFGRLAVRLLAAMILLPGSFANADDDIVVADFESDTYGEWTVAGDAFGDGPAEGTLPGQMAVTGFSGHRLVNSFHNGDGSTGTLTSPPITIERPFLNFQIGGGGYPGETCINLLIDGQVVRTATGPNSVSGGSEQLDWETWDVASFQGRQAILEIVDRRTGGWGHINVDQITLSDTRRAAEPVRRRLTIEQRYLHLPVKTGAPMRRMFLNVGGRNVREFEIELTSGPPDFLAFVDVGAWQDQELTIDVGRMPDGAAAVARIVPSDEIPNSDQTYRERDRPQFHFTSRRGWLNDPNGLVYADGEWHLFYQHNPYGWNWGNMHWGHAVSSDLLHWRELGEALHPWSDARGACFSGSAVVDARNTSGFGTGDGPLLVAAFTDTGAGEALAWSTDRGRTWNLYDGNPVVRHAGRDPKLLWHAPTGRWVMAVYDEFEQKQWIAFYSSPNLKDWTFESRIEGYFECPDLFELPVMGENGASRWVLYAADGRYVLGAFDGRVFSPEGEKQPLWSGDFYAAQTYSDAPDGRRVQIGWGRGITFPGMPFNQQMTIPVELTLRPTTDGLRMFAMPVRELDSLRGETLLAAERVALTDQPQTFALAAAANPPAGLDCEVVVAPGTARQVTVRIGGEELRYDVAKGELSCGHTATLPALEGRLTLRVLVDRGSIEVFANDGRVAISRGVRIGDLTQAVEVAAEGGAAELVRLEVHPLRSVWPASVAVAATAAADPAAANGSPSAELKIAGRSLEEWAREIAADSRPARLRGVKTVAAFGAPAVPVLAAALQHDDSAVRYWAASGLGDLGIVDATTRTRLLELLDDRSVGVRMSAAYALARGGEVEAGLPVLVEALERPDSPMRNGVRIAAADFLARIGPAARSAVPALQRAKQSRDTNFTGAVDEALRRISAP